MSLVTIKQEIKTILDELVTSEVLGGADITDIKKSPLDAEIPAYPMAYVMPPAIESSVSDNRTNIREHTFEILVIENAENLSSTTDLEGTIEAIMNKFDNNPTLNNTAQAGVSPATSAPEPIRHGSRDLIIFSVILKAREVVDLTF